MSISMQTHPSQARPLLLLWSRRPRFDGVAFSDSIRRVRYDFIDDNRTLRHQCSCGWVLHPDTCMPSTSEFDRQISGEAKQASDFFDGRRDFTTTDFPASSLCFRLHLFWYESIKKQMRWTQLPYCICSILMIEIKITLWSTGYVYWLRRKRVKLLLRWSTWRQRVTLYTELLVWHCCGHCLVRGTPYILMYNIMALGIELVHQI